MKPHATTCLAEFGAFRPGYGDPRRSRAVPRPEALIRERRCNAEWALVQRMEQLVAQFDEFEDPYLRERGQDVGRWSSVSSRAGRPCRRSNLCAGRHQGRKPDRRRADLSPADVIAFRSTISRRS